VVPFAAPTHLDNPPGEHVTGRGRGPVAGVAAAGCPDRLPCGVERGAGEASSRHQSRHLQQTERPTWVPLDRAVSRERHALGLNGIALPAHVCAQFSPLDRGMGFDTEQPHLGAALLAIGAGDDFALFGGCPWHVFTIGESEAVSR
jgi:hypothetical protein